MLEREDIKRDKELREMSGTGRQLAWSSKGYELVVDDV